MSEEINGRDNFTTRQITTTDLLRKLAGGAKIVLFVGGIWIIAATAGDPEKVVWIAIGCTAISYSGSLLVGWGALRNYGALYELVAFMIERQQRHDEATERRLNELRREIGLATADEVDRQRHGHRG